MADQQKIEKHKWSGTLILLLPSITSHIFVNKYVLSVLKFQYPTVFTSWQCGTCVFLLVSAYVLGYIEQLGNIDRSVLQSWSPCMVLYAGIMYSGSISLSKLAIPIFLALHNLIHYFIEVHTYWKSKKLPSMRIQFSLLVIGFGVICLVYWDLNRDPFAYKWVFICVACSGCYAVFSNITGDIKLSHLDKVFCNSSFSVIALTTLSILTGEWKKTMDFPFLYYIKFHIGCICSGVLYCMTAFFSNTLMKDTSSEIIQVSKSLNNVLISLVSFGIFEMNMNTYVAISVLMVFVGGIAYTYFKLEESMVEDEDLQSIKTNWK